MPNCNRLVYNLNEHDFIIQVFDIEQYVHVIDIYGVKPKKLLMKWQLLELLNAFTLSYKAVTCFCYETHCAPAFDPRLLRIRTGIDARQREISLHALRKRMRQ